MTEVSRCPPSTPSTQKHNENGYQEAGISDGITVLVGKRRRMLQAVFPHLCNDPIAIMLNHGRAPSLDYLIRIGMRIRFLTRSEIMTCISRQKNRGNCATHMRTSRMIAQERPDGKP